MQTPRRMPAGVQIGSAIPVLRMLDEAASRIFYIDYLGAVVDWEHRFTPEDPASPLYMQITLGRATFHLDGHADESAPVSQVRVPVFDLVGFCDWLATKSESGEQPSIVDPRYEGKPTDLNLLDPSGNMLVFWARELDDLGDSD